MAPDPSDGHVDSRGGEGRSEASGAMGRESGPACDGTMQLQCRGEASAPASSRTKS